MMSRRVFLKNGAFALVSLGFAPLVSRAHGVRGRAATRRQAADRDLPARRGRRPEHGRAARRRRLLSRAADASRSRGPAAQRTARSISTGSSDSIRASRRSKPFWDRGDLAVVHACGSPDSTRSHFDAQDYMESGTPGRQEHGRRVAEPLSAGAPSRTATAPSAPSRSRSSCRACCRAAPPRWR